MAKILVTGATGTVGSQVVEALAKEGVSVRAAVHSKKNAEGLSKLRAELADMDFGQPASLAKVLEGVERAFLLTPVSQDMVAHTKAFVEAAKNAGVKRIVKLSAAGADATPGITLGRWHRRAEELVEESGIPFAHLRPGPFMQNYATYYRDSIVKRNAIFLPAGDARLSLIDARDIGAVAAKVLLGTEFTGKAYGLTGPEALTHQQIAGILSKTLHRTISFVNTSDEAAKSAMLQAGTPPWFVEAILELFAGYRAGAAAEVLPTVRDILGRPPLTFERFARDNARAWAA